MKISLATSLQMNHSGVRYPVRPGDPMLMHEFLPTGLMSLQAAVHAAGIEADIRIIELNHLVNNGAIKNDNDFFTAIAQLIVRPGELLVGLMTDSDSLHHTVRIAQEVKRLSPETLVCLGGPAATPLHCELPARFECIDLIIRGEGEETFAALAAALRDRLPLGDIPGLTWRAGGEIIANPDREPTKDLDRLPFLELESYNLPGEAVIYLEVGRGCPFNCTFCSTAPFFSRSFRIKSVERVIREIKALIRWSGKKSIEMVHDVFTKDQDWVRRFCERLIEENLGIDWSCSTRTDVITPELMAQMKQAGCREIYYGIETGSRKMQQEIRKNLDLDRSLEIIRATKESGILPISGFIVGFPEETMETFGDTISRFFEFMEAGGYRSLLFVLCPYQQSRLYRRTAAKLDRLGEYYDLSLTRTAASPGKELIKAHKDLFAGLYRYETRNVPSYLVDAAEEISGQLIILKTVWPLLLSYYHSPLDWFTRWSDWIGKENAKFPQEAPAPSFCFSEWIDWLTGEDRSRQFSLPPHQGDVYRLLEFINQELERLGLTARPVADVVRYETKKLEALNSLPDGQPAKPYQPGDLNPRTLVKSRCRFVAARFDYDIGDLLAGRQPLEPLDNGRQWVLFAKPYDGSLRTFKVDDLAKRLLEKAAQPLSVGELINGGFPGGFPEQEDIDPEQGLGLIRQLMANGLMMEVPPP